MRRLIRVLVGSVLLSIAGCACGSGASYKNAGGNVENGFGGGAGTGGGAGVGGGAGGGCPCPSGFTCQGNACVPNEVEVDHSLANAPPVATPHYVYALNPTAASVARIDPASLSIEAVPVGPRPVALAAMPGEDAAVVLCAGDSSLSLIESSTLPSKVTRFALKREHGRLTLSPDGAFAVAWPDPALAPSSGAEGIFTLIDLKKARAGAPLAEVLMERAGGYRITNVVFRTDLGVATRVYIFAKSTASTFTLGSPVAILPARATLPASMSADISAREVVASEDGQVVMLRSTAAAELASFDGTAIRLVPLSEIATDLDLLPDGSMAVAALRTSGKVALIRIPQDVLTPAGIVEVVVPGGAVGQVALPPAVPAAGMFALVYSNAAGDESFARVNLPGGTVTRYPLEKLVDEISISPDSLSAVLIHKADPATTATDPYEAAVDRDQGFSVFDVGTGFWQLQRTGKVKPTRYAFSPLGGYVGVALRDDSAKVYALQAVNLSSLVSTTLPLASTPLFMGTVPQAPGITPHRVFVSQDHPAGRISVIQLDTNQVRTATGFTLNAEIQ
jgi:DNA-binding beta-propeller fold protein YncE